MYVRYNPNPQSKDVGDCVIRAISIVTNSTWEDTYISLCDLGFELHDMPSANYVWGEYLRRMGFKRHIIPDKCPYCYTVNDFCNDHQNGVFVLATGTHVIPIVSGSYIDSWDSGGEIPIYYYTLEEN